MRSVLAIVFTLVASSSAWALAPDDAGKAAIVKWCAEIDHASGHPCAI